MNASKAIPLAVAALVLSAPAFALKGHDESNRCDVELKGAYKLETLKTALKEGDKVTFFDGCEKKTVTLEVREINRWEKLDGVSYTIDTLDRSRMDNLRTRRFDMKAN